VGIKLQGFNLKIEHRSGRLTVVPDALSRVNEAELAYIKSSHGELIDLQSPQFRSDEYVKRPKRVKAYQDKLPDLKVVDGRVYRRSEHATGDQLHDNFTWKLWIRENSV